MKKVDILLFCKADSDGFAFVQCPQCQWKHKVSAMNIEKNLKIICLGPQYRQQLFPFFKISERCPGFVLKHRLTVQDV